VDRIITVGATPCGCPICRVSTGAYPYISTKILEEPYILTLCALCG